MVKAESLNVTSALKNPWLNDSVYPISHHDSGQTDTSKVMGPSLGKTLTHNAAKSVLAVWVSNPTIKTLAGKPNASSRLPPPIDHQPRQPTK